MPFQTPSDLKPKANSLVVCAGTITCQTVDDMGSGFLLFKKLFNSNSSYQDSPGGWKADLQQLLTAYNSRQSEMPAYVRIAKQDGLVGGVATVPCKPARIGRGFSVYKDDSERDKKFEDEYRLAVKQAIIDAKQLNRPLFLQPLGIGVYGWNPKFAAALFADVIVSEDPNDEIDITIPIFSPTEGSPSLAFKTALIAEMAQRGRHPSDTMKKVDTITTVDSKDVSLSMHRDVLSAIVGQLIHNIESKNGNRWTSGINSVKVKQLNQLQNIIKSDTGEIKAGSKEAEDYLLKIMKICEMKRNPLHFWATPESVGEYKALLQQHNINLPDETNAARHQI